MLKVGFARVNITPELGIPIIGYYIPRYAKGILDELEASVLALELGNTRALLISVDNEGIRGAQSLGYRKAVAQATGVPVEHVFLHATHTHTGPDQDMPGSDASARYAEFLGRRLQDAAVLALADLKNAKMGTIYGWAPERVAYIRRYKMKDGTTMTCPPVGDPNIDHPIGQLDQRVHVLRFDREGGDTVVLMNYGLHADTTNGELISADWPGWMRKTFETAVPGTKCVFFAGCEGDVGSTHVFPEGGDMNDTEISFDNEMKSPGMARFVGRALAGTILQVYDKVEYIPVEKLAVINKVVRVPANTPKPEELPLAHKYKELHDAGRDDLIPYTAMELTTVVAEAERMCRLEHGPEYFDLELSALRIGDVALVSLPGEPFTDVGVQIKATEGWKDILPIAITNGHQGYFPMKEAFDEGGYEARSSNYVSGVAESLIAGAKELLGELAQ